MVTTVFFLRFIKGRSAPSRAEESSTSETAVSKISGRSIDHPHFAGRTQAGWEPVKTRSESPQRHRPPNLDLEGDPGKRIFRGKLFQN